MLDQALQRLPGQVQPVERGVAPLEPGHDAQRLGVVVEAAERRHAVVERVLAGVAEGRVAEVVRQRQRLGEILVEAERAGERAGDLRHLDRMGQAGAVVVALVEDEDLGLVLEAAEGASNGRSRSRSRWNSLRVGEAGSRCSRPRLSQGLQA